MSKKSALFKPQIIFDEMEYYLDRFNERRIEKSIKNGLTEGMEECFPSVTGMTKKNSWIGYRAVCMQARILLRSCSAGTNTEYTSIRRPPTSHTIASG
ncbi:MAG: hypothetical protein Q8O17_01855 [Candidatus Methanoperedens sp.]|nr:hypothetical protein [Candidatus Methanoperedens sp.]